jgi:transposase
MRGSRQRISMASFLAYKLSKDGLCEGADARLYFEVQRASFTSASLIGALCNLSMELDEPGAERTPVTLVWDNIRTHHSESMRAFIAESPWLTVHYLPAYAPDENPVDGIWSASKGSDLANLCASERDELALAARNSLTRISDGQSRLWGFLKHTGLELDKSNLSPESQ